MRVLLQAKDYNILKDLHKIILHFKIDTACMEIISNSGFTFRCSVEFKLLARERLGNHKNVSYDYSSYFMKIYAS